MNRNTWLVIGVLLTLGALLAWQLRDVEPIEERVIAQRYSGAARQNPLYAAERLLDRLAMTVNSVRAAPAPATLNRDDALLLSQPSHTLSERYVNELLDWVDVGGTLLFTPRHSDAGGARGDDALLDALALNVQDRGRDADDANEINARLEQRYRLALNRRFALRDGGYADLLVNDQAGQTLVAGYRYGNGRIVAFADGTFINNRRIARLDHADFFIALLDNPVGTVWLQYAAAMPSLLALLWNYGWPLIVALALTLLAILWSGGRRFGPLLDAPPERQRSLLEHLRASGRFEWRHGGRGRLLDATRTRVEQALRRRYPDWPRLDDGGRLNRLAALTRLDPRQLEDALYGPTAAGANVFFERVRTLHTLHQHLLTTSGSADG